MKAFSLKIIFLTVNLGISFGLNAQKKNIRFDHISLEQGLSQSTVFCVLQDKRGFMWFGTEDGLNRYDGYTFKVYRHDPDDPNSLSDNEVRTIFEDHSGALWIGTLGGLNRLVLSESKSGGASPTFEHYKHEPDNPNSLSSNVVRAIFEDRSGVLWIGTGDGLNRLVPAEAESPVSSTSSGKESGPGAHDDAGAQQVFEHYESDPDNPNSLSNNDVRAIFEDDSGVLWIGTAGGLNKLVLREAEGLVPGDSDGTPPTFVHYRNEPNNPNSLSHNVVRAIFEDRSGTLWVGTEGGLNKLVLREAEGLVPGDNDEAPPTFLRYKHEPDNPNSLSSDVVRTIFEDRSGVIWIGTWGGGLDKLVQDDGTESPPFFVHYRHDPVNPGSLSSNEVRSIFEDDSGVLWIGTEEGLNKFSREQESFTQYKNQPGNPNSLSNDVVWSIHEDHSGALWIGTWGGGLNKLVAATGSSRKPAQSAWAANDNLPTFIHYEHEPNNPHSLSNNVVWSIHEDPSGALWIGTSDGLNKLDLSDNEALAPSMSFSKEAGHAQSNVAGVSPIFVHYRHDPNNPNSLSDNVVRAIYADQAGVLWVGTNAGGLNKLVLPAAPELRPSPTSSRNSNEVQPVIFVHYKHDPDNLHSLSNNRVWTIFEDQSGVLWIGTWGGGLNKLVLSEAEGLVRSTGASKNPSQQALDGNDSLTTFVRYQHEPNNPFSLSNNRVLSICESQSGVLWIGTAVGLNKFDRETERFTHYREKDGLPNDLIYGILEDRAGNLWLSTNKGLSKFNPRLQTFKNYDIHDGLQSNEFNTGAYHKSRSGQMFFGGISGFNAFYPEMVKDNPHIPPVVITAFKKFDEVIRNDITETVEAQLSYKDKYLVFEFAALDYRNPEKNQYAFMMEGFDEDWIHSDNRRFASYTNLDPGEYTFRVRGSNNDGVWNEAGTSLKITIEPPFWKTWWFRILVALAFAGILALAYNYRVSKLLEIERTRNRIARDLHDEIGSTLSSISYFAQAIRRDAEARGLAIPRKFLSLIAESSAEAQEAMSDIIWAIDPSNDRWEKLLAKLRRYASDLFDSSAIRYDIDLPESLPFTTMNMEQRRNFWLVYKEMVTNVAKHARCTEARIALTSNEKSIVLTVGDNGVGFEPDQPSERSGIRNIHARVRKLGADVRLQTQPGNGTDWRLELPL